jgi:hypothetical protein
VIDGSVPTHLCKRGVVSLHARQAISSDEISGSTGIKGLDGLRSATESAGVGWDSPDDQSDERGSRTRTAVADQSERQKVKSATISSVWLAPVAVSLNRDDTSPKLSALAATEYRFGVPFCGFVVAGFKFNGANRSPTFI